MLKAFRRFLTDLAGGATPDDPSAFDSDDYRLAAAALLVHMMMIDGIVGEDEKKILHRALSRYYNLSPDETNELIAEATIRNQEAVDLYAFTSVVKNHLDDTGRQNVVRMLWEMVFADGSVHEFEENMVWRVAELLGVSSRDRIRIRKEVEDGAPPS